MNSRSCTRSGLTCPHVRSSAPPDGPSRGSVWACHTDPSQILGLLTSGRGVFTARDAELAGVKADRIERMARTGLLQRVGRGAYARSHRATRCRESMGGLRHSEQGLRHVTHQARTCRGLVGGGAARTALRPWHWVVAEGDGALKYRGHDPVRVIAAEKERQWQIRRLGLDVIRYGWQLAAHRREELAARFRAVLADHPVRPTPVPWWPTDSPFIAQDGQVVA